MNAFVIVSSVLLLVSSCASSPQLKKSMGAPTRERALAIIRSHSGMHRDHALW